MGTYPAHQAQVESMAVRHGLQAGSKPTRAPSGSASRPPRAIDVRDFTRSEVRRWWSRSSGTAGRSSAITLTRRAVIFRLQALPVLRGQARETVDLLDQEDLAPKQFGPARHPPLP